MDAEILETRSEKFPVATVACALGFLSFWLLYLPYAARHIQASDGAEFALAAVKGSLVHPPGYPFYSWLSEVVVNIFPFPPYQALAYFSAFSQAVAVGLLVWVLFRLCDSLLLATALSAAWAVYEPTIRTGVDVEVFALHHALVLLVMMLALRVSNVKRSGAVSQVLLGIAVGLAISHQYLIVLFLPLVLGLVLRRGRDSHLGLVILSATVVAAIFYGSLFLRYWRAPDLAFAPLVSAIDFLTYILRGGYGVFSLTLEGSTAGVSFFGAVINGLVKSLAVAFFLSLLILPIALAKRSVIAWGALLTLIATFLFAHGLVLPPPVELLREWVMRFYPTIALAVILVAAISFSYMKRARGILTIIFASLSVIFSAVQAPAALARSDRSQDVAIENRIDEILRTAPQSAVLLIGTDWILFGLDFKQNVYDLRPDVTIVSIGKLESPFYRKRMQTLFAGSDIEEGRLNEMGVLARLIIGSGRPVLAEPGVAVPDGLVVRPQGSLMIWSLVSASDGS